MEMEKTEIKKSGLLVALTALVALVMCFSLAGCGSGSDSDSSTSDQGSASVKKADSEKSPVTIKSCKTGKDYEGKKAAIITIQWTNDGDKKANFLTTYTMTAYVDGEEADTTFGDGDGWYNDQKDIKKGKTQTFKKMIEWDGTSDIEVEVTDWLDSDKVIAKKTFKM